MCFFLFELFEPFYIWLTSLHRNIMKHLEFLSHPNLRPDLALPSNWPVRRPEMPWSLANFQKDSGTWLASCDPWVRHWGGVNDPPSLYSDGNQQWGGTLGTCRNIGPEEIGRLDMLILTILRLSKHLADMSGGPKHRPNRPTVGSRALCKLYL